MKLLLGSLIILVLGSAQAAEEKIQLSPAWIDQLVEQARTNSPILFGAEARVKASEFGAAKIKAWEDPVLTAGAIIAKRKLLEEEGDILFGIEQPLPFGKPTAERKVAEAAVEVARADQELRFQRLRRDIALAAFDIGLSDYGLRISKEDLSLLETWITLAESRYSTGNGSQLEILRLQNELARRTEARKTDAASREHKTLRLSRLVNRSEPHWPALVLPAPAPTFPFSDKLLQMALRNEPELKKRKQEIEESRARQQWARVQRRPDISLGVDSRGYSRSGQFKEGSVFLSVTVPWLNERRYRAGVQEAESTTESLHWEARDWELQINEEIHMLYTEIDAARREALRLEQEIIPRSQMAIENAVDRWRSNVGSFNDVMESRRMLLESRILFGTAVAKQYSQMAQLVLCCGLGDLQSLQMIQPQPEKK